MNLVFTSGTVVFMVIGLYFFAKNKNDSEKAKQDILLYSVVPSLIFGASGHLVLAKQVRGWQKWGNSPGVVTLQRELGLFTLALLAVALWKREDDVGLIWGIFLVLTGLNHIIVQKKITDVAVADIVYGAFLLKVFGERT